MAFWFASGALPTMGAILFGYTTYLSVKAGDDPLSGAFSLAVYCVFLLSTGSILYAQSLPKDGFEKKQRALWIVVSLFFIICVAFFSYAFVIVPRHAYYVLLPPCLLPVFAALAFYFVRRGMLSSSINCA